MKDSTVRNKIILSFSVVALLIVGLCGFAYVQLRAIETEVAVARLEPVPGLDLAARMEAVSISTFTSVQRLVEEGDESKARTLQDYLAAKTAERQELLGQYKRLIRCICVPAGILNPVVVSIRGATGKNARKPQIVRPARSARPQNPLKDYSILGSFSPALRNQEKNL